MANTNKPVRNTEFYLNRATEMFDAGFTTQSAKKRANEDLARAYECQAQFIRNTCLETPHAERTEAQDNVYWGIPDLHNWKAKHAALVLGEFPQHNGTVAMIERLVEMRAAVKAAEILPVQRKEDPRVALITSRVRDIIELRTEQFARGLRLVDVFKTLPVSMNCHWVRNQYGTEFMRVFYYMGDKLTPLNMILAILDATSED
jgi:hypothetical protein